MKRITVLVAVLALMLLWRWVSVRDREATPPDTPTATSTDASSSYTVVPVESYTAAAEALAQDDFARAKESLTLLATESKGDLQARARAAANAADIESMREYFKSMSERAVIFMSYPDDYAVAFCPTYKDGSKWIQRRDAPISNPYLGKARPDCGYFVD